MWCLCVHACVRACVHVCRDLRDTALDEASRTKAELRQLREAYEELLVSSREAASRADVANSHLMGELQLKGFELSRLQVSCQHTVQNVSSPDGACGCSRKVMQLGSHTPGTLPLLCPCGGGVPQRRWGLELLTSSQPWLLLQGQARRRVRCSCASIQREGAKI